MAKKIITVAPENKTFGFTRLADGEHTITKLACFKDKFTDGAGEEREYDVLAVFVDGDGDDKFLRLNGCWKPRAAKDAATGHTVIVKASGSLFDKLLTDLDGLTYKAICDQFNDPAKGFVGKKFRLDWVPYVPADADYTGFAYTPKADFVD